MKTETSTDGETSEACVKKEEPLELNIDNYGDDLDNPPEGLSVKVEDPGDKDYLYCEVCKSFFLNKCEVHGPPLFIPDTPVPMGVPDRARQTLPPGLELQKSSIPDAGLGVFNKGETVPVGAHFGPCQGELMNREEAKSSGDSSVLCEDMKTETSTDGETSEACVKKEEPLELNIYNYGDDLDNPPEGLSVKVEDPGDKDYLCQSMSAPVQARDQRGGSRHKDEQRSSSTQSMSPFTPGRDRDQRGGSRHGDRRRSASTQSMSPFTPVRDRDQRGGSRHGDRRRSASTQSTSPFTPGRDRDQRGGSRHGDRWRSASTQSTSHIPARDQRGGSRHGAAQSSSSSQSMRGRSSYPMEMGKFQKMVMRRFADLLEKLDRMEQAKGPTSSTPYLKQLATVEEVLMLEEKLNQEEGERQALITQLTKVGGKDVRDCCAKVLQRLMTNGAMAHFNMKGHGGKTAFKPMVLYAVVIAAVKKWSSQATDHDIDKAVADHLKHAPGRNGGGGYRK